PLFTWCAFDTVLFPPLLQVEAHVQSVCSATGHPITFVATPSAFAISFQRLPCCRLSCPPSGATVCAEPFVSSHSFSRRKRLPRPGWHCIPKRSSSRSR